MWLGLKGYSSLISLCSLYFSVGGNVPWFKGMCAIGGRPAGLNITKMWGLIVGVTVYIRNPQSICEGRRMDHLRPLNQGHFWCSLFQAPQDLERAWHVANEFKVYKGQVIARRSHSGGDDIVSFLHACFPGGLEEGWVIEKNALSDLPCRYEVRINSC